MQHFKNMGCKQPDEVIAAMVNLAKTLRGFMLFSGSNGTGKTFSAQCLFQLVKRMNQVPSFNPGDPNRDQYEQDPIFYTQADLNIKWLSDCNKWGDAMYLLNKLKNSKFLVLDDLGTKTPTDAFMDYVYAFIDYRSSENKATLITTNLNSKDMRLKFGDAFFDRVASGKCFRFEGKSRRGNEF